MAFVVFAGQSNMGGPYTELQNVNPAWRLDPLTQIWNTQTRAWEVLRPGVSTGYEGFPNQWGPEVQFAIDFRAAHPDEPLRIVKSVFGGTPLQADHQQWHADWSPGSDGELVDRTAATIAQASAAAGGARPDMVFFGQGEADAGIPSAAAAYAQNLTAFIAEIRGSWLGDSAGRVGLFQINGNSPHAAEVRDAQARVDAADARVSSLDTLGLATGRDELHFADVSYDLIGRGFFRLYEGQAPTGERLIGSAFSDTLIAGGGADTLAGGYGADFLRGGDGDDVMTGGDFFDDMHGNQGRDTLSGGSGGDWVVGGQGDDRLFGDDGDDIVYGNLADDVLDGGSGADLVRGGQGNDLIFGRDADDWLSGDRGDDTLAGGWGNDIFHTFAEAGLDRVVDFTPGQDRVQLTAGSRYAVNQEGGDTVVALEGGARLVLVGVNAGSLPAGWIFGF